MDLQSLKQIVYETNLELVKRNLVIYTWGNTSAIDREKGIVVIKPRGVEYSDLEASDMSVVDLNTGKQIEKGLLPSVDLDIHLEIYKKYPTIGGIAHTHSTYATAWSQAQRAIPVYGTTHADHFFGDIPCTRHLSEEEVATDAYEGNLGKLICETIGDRDPLEMGAILAAGHGPFTWGKDAYSAVEHSVILEELAKMASVTDSIQPGNDKLLPQYMTNRHYTRKYGAKAYFYQSK